ncbi:hypothetical protein PIB30_061019 [Stylosanthes scabra]|uniref:Putative plant transposon protein domain-containing protein n=1 Tax=Stylosanthes scabra TaxID=79078 RepID=A0ABU6UKM5_9FABA|nr:hypothetical protein [Stylosanthes scabra]
MLAHEIQEVRKSQINQTLGNNKRAETEKKLQQPVERQGRDIAEMRKQLTLWTRNTSAREAYTCWAHQQANPNLSEIPITQIPDLMQTNAEKGRPMFFGCLCELHLLFRVTKHHILLLISPKAASINHSNGLILSPASVFDDYRFRTEFNQTLFKSIVRKKKVTPEVGFNLDEDEYPQIKEQIALRGWRRLAAPMTDISKLLVQEFYANAVVLDEEMEDAGQLPYKIYVRGVEVDFSPENIRRVMRCKEETLGAETGYTTRQATDQRLDEVLADLCVPGAIWKLSSSQPAVPIQLRRAELFPLARGWQEFTINSLVPTGNKSEITLARAILIHSIMKGEEVRVENIIADNIAVIAQGLHGKGKLGFPSTIYKLCKDARVPMREFKRTSRIPQEKPITAKQMETTRLLINILQQQQDEDDEDEPMPQAGGGNEEDQDQ